MQQTASKPDAVLFVLCVCYGVCKCACVMMGDVVWLSQFVDVSSLAVFCCVVVTQFSLRGDKETRRSRDQQQKVSKPESVRRERDEAWNVCYPCTCHSATTAQNAQKSIQTRDMHAIDQLQTTEPREISASAAPLLDLLPCSEQPNKVVLLRIALNCIPLFQTDPSEVKRLLAPPFLIHHGHHTLLPAPLDYPVLK